MTNFILASLAVYALATLISAYSGPMMIFAHLRKFAGNIGARELVECPVCLSVWVAIPFAVLISNDLSQFVLNWLGIVGIVILVKEWE